MEGKYRKGGRNYYCDRCMDTGSIFFGFKVCPKCEGKPENVRPPRPRRSVAHRSVKEWLITLNPNDAKWCQDVKDAKSFDELEKIVQPVVSEIGWLNLEELSKIMRGCHPARSSINGL